MKGNTFREDRLVAFVVTADQVDSRHRPDAVPDALEALSALSAPSTVSSQSTPAARASACAPPHGRMWLPFDRTVGDEVQGLTDDPAAVVDAVVDLSRLGGWRIGVGVGPVDRPLPATTREARGSAYIAARDAVERARRQATRIALDASASVPRKTMARRAADGEAGAGPSGPAVVGGPDGAPETVGGVPYGGPVPVHARARRAETALIALRALLARRTAEGWEAMALIDRGLSNRAAADVLGVSESAMSQRVARAQLDEAGRLAELCTALLGDLAAAVSAELDADAVSRPDGAAETGSDAKERE